MRMTITLREQAYEQLRDAARDERRPVREHAAYLLERQLLTPPRVASDDPQPTPEAVR